jgi:hypothetical protein
MLISNGSKEHQKSPKSNTKSLEVLDSNPRKDRRTGYSDYYGERKNEKKLETPYIFNS